jgi:hypothetical protein
MTPEIPPRREAMRRYMRGDITAEEYAVAVDARVKADLQRDRLRRAGVIPGPEDPKAFWRGLRNGSVIGLILWAAIIFLALKACG